MLEKPIIAESEIAAIVARVAQELRHDNLLYHIDNATYCAGYESGVVRFEIEMYKAIRAREEK